MFSFCTLNNESIYITRTDDKNEARKSSAGKIQGELKLSLEYRKDALLVMVHHAKDLAMPDGSKEAPNSYVKVLKTEVFNILSANLTKCFMRPILTCIYLFRSTFIQILPKQPREKQKLFAEIAIQHLWRW